MKYAAKNKLVREFGEGFVEKLAEHTDDFAGVKKGIRKLQKLGVSDDILREMGERFGTDGYGWLLKKRPLGLDNDILRKLTQADNFMDYSDELLDAVRNSDGHADDIIKAVSTYGDDAADAITKYGDDAADIIAKHGEDGLSWIKKYEKDALDVIHEYGDEAVDSLKKGMTPDEIRLDYGGSVSGGLVKDGLGKISGREYAVTRDGINNVKNYLTSQGFIEDYENQAMIERLENALESGERITGADAVFYTHELKEAQLVASGVAQAEAHELALQYYEVSPYSVYHPEVIKMEPGWWNNAWFEFWDIER